MIAFAFLCDISRFGVLLGMAAEIAPLSEQIPLAHKFRVGIMLHALGLNLLAHLRK